MRWRPGLDLASARVMSVVFSEPRKAKPALSRIRGRELLAPVTVPVELVPRVRHARQTEESLVERVLQPAIHRAELVPRGADGAIDGAREPEDADPQVRVPEERSDVGPHRVPAEEVDVLARGRPRLAGTEQRQHLGARDRLDAREHVRAVLGVGEDGADGAAADRDRGDAVADGLGEGGRGEELGVVVGVDVEEAGHHPPAARVDDAGATRRVERGLADGGHAAVADADVAEGAGRAGAVEEEALLQDDVVAHEGER